MPTMTAQQWRDEARVEFDAYLAECPSRKLLDRIADKWVALVVKSLVDGPKRYSELSHQLAGVSQKMLTQTLRSLERDGVLTRTVTPSVPVRVDYELTPLGESLAGVLGELKMWAEQHMPEVDRSPRRLRRATTIAPRAPTALVFLRPRSALHQFADMGADRIRKTLKVVATFQNRDEAAFAVRLRRFHQFACHPGEIVSRHAQ